MPRPQVISLDVFGTVLRRTLSEVRVREIIHRRISAWLERSCGVGIKPEQLLGEWRAFLDTREREIRQSGGEWSHIDWYRHLSELTDVDADSMVERGLSIERNLEQEVTRPVPGVREVMRVLRSRGFELVAVSDTQHLERDLFSLLMHHELYFDEVFSSSSKVASKRAGGLFVDVEQSMRRAPDSFLHVGDNLKSDYLRPLGRGWRAVWLPRSRRTPSVRLGVGARPASRVAARVQELLHGLELKAPKQCGVLYRFGFEQLARFMVIHWLWQREVVRREDISDLLYIARDGRAFLSAHTILDEAFQPLARRHYVHLSRQTVAMSHPDDFLLSSSEIGGKTRHDTIRDFLAQFWLPDHLHRQLMDTADVEPSTSWDARARAKLIRAVNLCRDDMRAEQQRQRSMLSDYVGSFVGDTEGRVGLVDSGWAGTIQDAVRHVWSSDVGLVGMYIGVSSAGRVPTRRSSKYGLIWDAYRRDIPYDQLARTAGSVRIWELILADETEGHTSALRRRATGEVSPVIDSPLSRDDTEFMSLAQIRRGMKDGIHARLESLRVLEDIGPEISLKVLEWAARVGARHFLCFPGRDLAGELLQLGFEDNLSGGRRLTLGVRDIRHGIAWFPGIAGRLAGRPGQYISHLIAETAGRLVRR